MVLRFVGQVVPNAFYAFLETIFALFDLLFSLLGFLTDFFFQLAGAFVDIVDAVFIPVRVLLGMVLDFAYALLEVSDLIPFLLSYFLLGVAGFLPYLFLRVSDRPVEFVYPVAQPVFVAVAAILVRAFFFHDSMLFTLNDREGLSSAVHAVDVRIDRGDILFDGPFGDDLVRVLLGSPRNRRRVARRQLRSGADMLRSRAVRLTVGPSGRIFSVHSQCVFSICSGLAGLRRFWEQRSYHSFLGDSFRKRFRLY